MSDNKDKNVFYINHSGELLFWLIIILCFVIFGFFSHLYENKKENVYNIFMPDVNGLIVGSPVRTMGIEIGHVTKIKPVRGEVFVRFIITDKSIKLPQGTVATVEFSGMAGSRSLELYLPDKDTYIDSSVPLLAVSPPKRLSDATSLLKEMFKHIQAIIVISSQFGKNVGEIDFPEVGDKPGDLSEFLKYSDNIIDIQQKRAEDFGRKLENVKSKKR